MLKMLKDSKWNIGGEVIPFKKGQVIKDTDVPIFIYNDMINGGIAEGIKDENKSMKDLDNKSLKEKDIKNKSAKPKKRGRPFKKRKGVK